MKKLFSRFCLIVLLLTSFTHIVMAQTQISGKVVDENNQPIEGAVVMVEGTTNGTSTAQDGTFSLVADKGNVLIVNCIGFADQKLTVTSAVTYDVVLKEDTIMLEELVVVGYDVQKKVNLTGSVSSVSTENLQNRPITQTSTALQGAMAGVTVTTQSGNPGASGGEIRVRGIGTFGGSSASPLILIDGVQGSIDDVDASQIESISVLKDAASSAIYGSRAANGVILVTTKRAGKEQFSVTYRGYTGWSQPTDIPDLVDAIQYMTLSREASLNDGATPAYTEEYIANYMENHRLDPDTYPITDWQGKVLNGSGFMHSHALSVNAGGSMVKDNLSLGYLKQEGIIRNQNFERYNIRNNMTIDAHEKFQIRFDSALNFGRRKANPLAGTLFNMMNTRDPLILTQWSSGDYAPMTGGSTNILPATEGQGGNKRVDVLNLTGAISATWKPVDWLTVDAKYAPRLYVSHTHLFNDVIEYYADQYGHKSPVTSRLYNELTESQTINFYNTAQATVSFQKNFGGNHDFKVLLGTSYESLSKRTFAASRQNLAYVEYDVLNIGADDETKDNSGSRSQWALMSYFSRINYNYKERYLLEANIRFDGSSRFLASNRWGIFPSFSAAWRVTEEPWMKNISNTLTQLKFRASYGQLGNQNISSSNYPYVELLSLGSYTVNGAIQSTVNRSSLANERITWETSEMYDVGIDVALWNKLTLTADWYYKTTDGILMKLNIPLTTGLGAPYQNAGVVRNVGWEVALGYHDNWGDFNFGVDANLSDVQNTIVDMGGQYASASNGIIRNREGSSINSIYGLKTGGIVRTQAEADWVNENLPQYGNNIKAGDLYYLDTTGDGKVTDDDMTIIGSAIPRYTYGLTLNFGWKGLNLMAFFQGVGKADGYLTSNYVQPCINGGTFRVEHLDRWTETNPDGKYPRMSYSSEQNRRQSDFWMRDASYLRLKNLQLSYEIPSRLTKKAGIKKLMVFANAENLFTFTNFYQGYDPEVGYDSSASDGVSLGAASNYPQVKTYTVGIELKF